MIIKSPGDVAFNILGFKIYFYGIVLALAIFVGIYLAYFLYKKFYDYKKATKIFDFAPLVIILGIIGARLYYCIVNFHYYIFEPIQILDFRQGGLSVHGMLILGLLALWYSAKYYKMNVLAVFDCFLCGTALAQSIGRWGNFFNSEAFGLPYNGFLKLYIPLSHRPEQFIGYQYFHPTFLYESILDFFVFLILLFLFRKFVKSPGVICCLYLILYSIVRIFTESMRIDSVLNIYGIPIAQIVSVIVLIIGFVGLPICIKYSKFEK